MNQNVTMAIGEITEGRSGLKTKQNKKPGNIMLTVWAYLIKETIWEYQFIVIIKVTVKICFCIYTVFRNSE